jgi:hypothetical protein
VLKLTYQAMADSVHCAPAFGRAGWPVFGCGEETESLFDRLKVR